MSQRRPVLHAVQRAANVAVVLLFLWGKCPKPLTIDPENPGRYLTVLLAPNTLYGEQKDVQRQKSHQEVNPLNGLRDLMFSRQELAKAQEKNVSACEGETLFREPC